MRRRLIAFDLDDTVTVSKSLVTEAMADRIVSLLERFDVALISGGRFEQFDEQVLSHLEQSNFERLHILPTSGTRYYRFVDGEWLAQYAEDLTETEKDVIIRVLERSAKELGLWEVETYGEVIEDRGSQITFSALGQQAPSELKYRWDPTQEKKRALRDHAAPLLPNMSVRMGGTTSIDVTREGVDKAYGMRRLMQATGLSEAEILFYGDQLREGGNDFPVKEMGIDTIEVAGCSETIVAIDSILAVV